MGITVKRSILSFFLLALTALPSQAQIAYTRPEPRSEIVGGWRVGRVDAAARIAAETAVRAIRRPHAPLAAINLVETQVVAGLNYRLLLTLSDHSRWQAVVWRRLDGTMKVTSIRPAYRTSPRPIR